MLEIFLFFSFIKKMTKDDVCMILREKKAPKQKRVEDP